MCVSLTRCFSSHESNSLLQACTLLAIFVLLFFIRIWCTQIQIPNITLVHDLDPHCGSISCLFFDSRICRLIRIYWVLSRLIRIRCDSSFVSLVVLCSWREGRQCFQRRTQHGKLMKSAKNLKKYLKHSTIHVRHFSRNLSMLM